MIHFFIEGTPVPGGSKKAFFNKKTGRAMIVDAAGQRNRDWKEHCYWAAREAYAGKPLEGPIWFSVAFYMPRPKGHYGTGKNAGKLKENAPLFPTTRPDRTKLLRALEDGLTGVLWKDDAQVVSGSIYRVYAVNGMVGAEVWVKEIKNATVGSIWRGQSETEVTPREGIDVSKIVRPAAIAMGASLCGLPQKGREAVRHGVFFEDGPANERRDPEKYFGGTEMANPDVGYAEPET